MKGIVCITWVQIDHWRDIRATLDPKLPELAKHFSWVGESPLRINCERSVVVLYQMVLYQ